VSDDISGLEDLTRYGDVWSDRGISRDYTPPVIQGDYNDLSLDQDVERPLLENYVVDTDRNMFFIDDHNHALAGWTAALYEGLMSGETAFVHIDFHEDRKQPPEYLQTVEAYGYDQPLPDEVLLTVDKLNSVVPNLQINEFVEPALQWGFFDEVYNCGLRQRKEDGGYRTELELIQEADLSKYDSVVVDIDIDFYLGLDGERHRYDEDKIREFEGSVAETAARADFVTWATSPGFMDQQEAVEKIESVVELSEEF
jgi:hypothetical protein